MPNDYINKVTVNEVDYDLRDDSAVRFDTEQSLTDAQKAQARENIGGASDEDVNDLKSAFTANLIHDTAHGSIANFPDGAALPVMDLSVDIEPVQTGSGDPSPDNIRPITGWTGCEVTRTGRNLFSYENIKSKTVYRATVRPIGEDLNSFYLCGANGTQDRPQLNVASWAYVSVFIGLRVEEETAITVSCKVKNYTENCNGFVRVRYNTTDSRNGSTVVNTVNFSTVGTSNISISGIIPSGNYVFFEFSPAAKSSDTTLTQYAEVTDFQLELGSTATDYEAYNSDTYTIDWTDEAGTVYGGSLDVTTGKLTVDREFHTYDENVSFNIQRVDNNRALVMLRGAIAWLDNYTADYICDRFSTDTARTTNDTIGSYFYSGTFRIRTPESWGTTEGEIATALANNPVTFVYPLAEPVVYDLTPTEVTTLLGTNNVWVDTGDTTVEYYADPTLYINRKIAAAVAAMS